MKRFNNKVTHQIIRKVHSLLGDVKTGEELIDYLRSTEPIFMQEVSRFVTIELDKINKDFPGDEDFLQYIGSVLGAGYIVGFLVAREMDHKIYEGLIDFESLIKKPLTPEPNYMDKLIDENTRKEYKPKESGDMLKKYASNNKKKPSKKSIKKKKIKRINIDFDEGEL